MPPSTDHARIQRAYARLHAQALGAWQRRCCLRPSRFWNVALGGGRWRADERRHLADCRRCRRDQFRVTAAVMPAAE